MTRAKEHSIHREQWIPAPLIEVFAFFCKAENLDRITPPWLNFRILKEPEKIEKGVLINYQLAWHGFPMRWTTLIEDWNPPNHFVDVQLRGPYRLWHHSHIFEERDGGTLMRDLLRYAIPAGILGDFFAGWRVHRDVERIFGYRAEQIRALFGSATQ